MVRVKEIFTSIQGEGPYVGYKQLFIRLCGCNLNCSYCDTDFGVNDSKEYSVALWYGYDKISHKHYMVPWDGTVGRRKLAAKLSKVIFQTNSKLVTSK